MSKFQVGDDLFLDSSHQLVRKNNLNITLPEPTFRLLLCLVENAPNTVSHDQLIKSVWQERVVSDENLKKRISRLRLALLDNSNKPSYIISERGLGYRCIAPVKRVSELDDIFPHEEANSGKSESACAAIWYKKKSFLLLVITIFIIGITGLYISQPIGRLATVIEQPKPKATTNNDAIEGAQYYYQYSSTGNNKAIELFKKSIDSTPNSGSTYAALANAYAQGYYQFGKPKNYLQMANDLAIQAVESEPRQAWGYNAVGFALYLEGSYSSSNSAFKKAKKLSPNWALPLSSSALVELSVGNMFLAYQKAIKAVEKDPSNPVHLAILGRCYQALGMHESAKSTLSKLLEQNPNYLLAQNYLAELYLLIGETESALIKLNDIIMAVPNSQLAHWLKGQSNLQMGQHKLAEASFKSAAQLGGQYELPSRIYLALLNKNSAQVESLSQQLNTKISQGNQWPELLFDKALISLLKGHHQDSILEFRSALDAGFNQDYRFKNLHLLSPIISMPEFVSLLDKLQQRKIIQRQKVIQLEYLENE
jgi:DNA-binding winged helix-turn-helix (wHTH) protein/Tfp pilus assembly protein PilF